MSVCILLKSLTGGFAVGVAVAAAIFWHMASTITIETPDVLQQLRRQNELNAKAAWWSFSSALLQWVALALWSYC
jgi:hypothetical protein